MTVLALVLIGLPLLPLTLTLVNLVTWRAPQPAPVPGKASALVPARNEAAGIERCLRALLGEPFTEVLVYDDRSTDGTAAILSRLAAEQPRLRILTGGELPRGWVGKAHACHHLGEAASGDVLVFVDADTVLRPGALARIAGVPAGVVSALPFQRMETAGERLVVPLLHLTYLSWLPLVLVARTRDSRVVAANGQVLCLSREALRLTGGFETVRSEIVDDVAFCRAAKRAGVTVAFVDGGAIAECRMYTSFSDAWQGFSKNLYEGIGGRPAALLGVVALYVGCFLLPWLALPFAPRLAAAGIAIGLLQRAALALRFRLPASTVLTHPLAILVFVGMAFGSAWWSFTGDIRWRGRTYPARAARGP